jgi:hypothetical protein
MHTQVYLNNRNHLLDYDTRIGVIDQVIMTQTHNNVLQVPMKTRSVSQEAYDNFINECKVWWVWNRNVERITAIIDFKKYFDAGQEDPIIAEWESVIWNMWYALDRNDAEYLDDIDMQGALFNREFIQWTVQVPFNPMNGKIWRP